jgi:hypothetical protein
MKSKFPHLFFKTKFEKIGQIWEEFEKIKKIKPVLSLLSQAIEKW